MVLYNIIVAHDNNNGIGKNNSIPWYLSEDLQRFAKLTKGNGNNAIIMGKNTWLSLPNKPLKDRDNLILSNKLNIEKNTPKNTYIKSYNNIKELEAYCESQKYDEIWIIGGSQIYKTFINDNKINLIYVTVIDNSYNCDTFFPSISEWKIIDK